MFLLSTQEDEIEVHTRGWKGGTSLFRDVPLESVFLGRSSVLNRVYNFISAYPKPVFFFFFQEIAKHIQGVPKVRSSNFMHYNF